MNEISRAWGRFNNHTASAEDLLAVLADIEKYPVVFDEKSKTISRPVPAGHYTKQQGKSE